MRSAVTLALLACCACSGIHTESARDEAADFGQLRTYRWKRQPPDFGMDQLTARRVRDAVDADLQAKGFVPSNEQPDFLVTAHGGTKRIDHVANWGYDRRWAVGQDVYSYRRGTLIVDVVEAAENQLIWRGLARTELDHEATPEGRVARIEAMIQALLSGFPPAAARPPSPRPGP